MDRRNFIINTSLCVGAFCMGCGCSKDNNILPDAVVIESCTMCQLHCPECWRTKEPDRMPLGYLKFEDFKHFVNNNSFVNKIDLSLCGEMFLNPDLDKIIKYANERGIYLSAKTGVNLNTLSDEIAELLVTQNFGEMIISIDGASQETYSIYRRGGDFNKVIENIKKIQFYQKKYNSFETPKLVWKFIPFGHNEHEIPKAKQMAKELGIPIKFGQNYSKTYSPIKNIDFVEKETGLNLKNIRTDFNEYYIGSQYENYISGKSPWFFCVSFFSEPIIFYNGRFVGCCLNYYKEAPNINVFKLGLEKALYSKEVQNIIDVFGLNANSKATMCETCDTLKYLKKHNIKISRESHQKLLEKYFPYLVYNV